MFSFHVQIPFDTCGRNLGAHTNRDKPTKRLHEAPARFPLPGRFDIAVNPCTISPHLSPSLLHDARSHPHYSVPLRFFAVTSRDGESSGCLLRRRRCPARLEGKVSSSGCLPLLTSQYRSSEAKLEPQAVLLSQFSNQRSSCSRGFW